MIKPPWKREWLKVTPQQFEMMVCEYLQKVKSGLFSPLSFGESNIKARIKNIISFKSPKSWVSAVSLLVVAIVAVGCFTNSGVNITGLTGERGYNKNGNLVNMGFAAMDDEWIYYCVPDFIAFENWSIYKIRNNEDSTTKIYGEIAISLNVIDDWIYHISGDVNGARTYIYKIRTDGSERNRVGDDSLEGNVIIVEDGWIYYIAGDGILKIRADGSERTHVLDYKPFNTFTIADGWVYYVNMEEGQTIHRIKTDGTDMEKISDDMTVSHKIIAEDGWIYYLTYTYDESDTFLYKRRTDGTERTRVIDDKFYALTTFNVAGGWIYYSTYQEGSVGPLIYKIRTDGSMRTLVLDASERSRPGLPHAHIDEINVVGEWVFYWIGEYPNNAEEKVRSVHKVRTDGSRNQPLN